MDKKISFLFSFIKYKIEYRNLYLQYSKYRKFNFNVYIAKI